MGLGLSGRQPEGLRLKPLPHWRLWGTESPVFAGQSDEAFFNGRRADQAGIQCL
jgi:hypothetical protein